jgi:hypothetical protein
MTTAKLFFVGALLIFQMHPAASELPIKLASEWSPSNTHLGAYLGDWTLLQTADLQVPFTHLPSPTSSSGPKAQRTWRNANTVSIKDVAVRIHWQQRAAKYKTTLFHVNGAARVIVDNVIIQSADTDARMYDTIFIENVDEVIVRNVHLSGPVANYHLRIEGAKTVVIDRIEINGSAVNGTEGYVAGGGIYIKPSLEQASKAATATWTQIQNCYIHDFNAADLWRNQDAINIESPDNGLIFNCVISNWGIEKKAGDAAIDASYRQPEAIGASQFLIERNVFINALLNKTPGNGATDKLLIWRNNLYVNTQLADYHAGYLSVHENNTFVLWNTGRLYRMWAQGKNGRTLFHSNVVYAGSGLQAVYFANPDGVPDKLNLLSTAHNQYFFAGAPNWLTSPHRNVHSFDDWRAEGNDDTSLLFAPLDCSPRNTVKEAVECAPKARVVRPSPFISGPAPERFFSGRSRTESSPPGAFETAPWDSPSTRHFFSENGLQ